MNQPPIYVVMNRHIIAANRKLPLAERQPAVRVTRGKHGKPVYCDQVVFHGRSELLNGMGEPVMPCGASIAILTEDAVTLHTHDQPPVNLEACRPLDLVA